MASKLEFNEQTFNELSSFLEKTLSPDPNVRRPGLKYILLVLK